jgi:2-methylaconitate cis-trans-isomerase PrpF
MKIPCTIMRGGTSKGIILRPDNLPSDPAARDAIILRIFGSPDRRQIDGLGGADPLTSKLALVGPPSRADADIDYTFADVLIQDATVDYSGYCGNITSAVAAYAVDEGFAPITEPVTIVRIHNTNTKRLITASVPVERGRAVERGDVIIAGVPGSGAPILLDFADTSGSFTGRLLPAGITTNLPGPGGVVASVLDVGNPMVFVPAAAFGVDVNDGLEELNGRKELLRALTDLRIAGARILGLFQNGQPTSESVPAVALVAAPADYTSYSTGQMIAAETMDLWAREFFLGSFHKAYGVSETVCTAVAASIPGTVVHVVAREPAARRGAVRIGHPSGVIDATVKLDLSPEGPVLRKVTIQRTARRLLDGLAYVPDEGPVR